MNPPVCPHLSSDQKVLIVCEKPSVARDLAAVLGGSKDAGGYIPYPGGFISWARGHFLELAAPEVYDPAWAKWVWETLPMVPPDFKFKSVVRGDSAQQLAVLKDLYGKADVVVNACDAGREGELIWWEILRYCGWGKSLPPGQPGQKPALRFWAQSNTTEGLKEAWAGMQPVSTRLGLALAAYSRSEADWLLGMNASRSSSLCFTRPVVDGKRLVWSVGRVQTPVLALISGRDEEIANFKPRPFYEVRGVFEGDTSFEATLLVPEGVPPFVPDGETPKEVKAFLEKADAEAALSRILASRPGPWAVSDEEKHGNENAPVLFSLTDLQKWCNQFWGWEAKRTLDAAQSAYETGKTLSYPRTDACFLPVDSKEKMDAVYQAVHSNFLVGRTQLPGWSCPPSESSRAGYLFDDSKLTDHYAIVPTGIIPSDLTSDAGRVWLAVLRRFVVAFGPAAKTVSLKRRLTLGADVAVCSGKRYLDRGWLEADDLLAPLTGQEAKSDPSTLPACPAQVPLLEGRLHEGKTTPPKALTEATLLTLMENVHAKLDVEEEELKDVLSKKGIGTPATRAATIELLVLRGYIQRVKKGSTTYIVSTEFGRQLIGNLRGLNLDFLTSAALTADWEGRLLNMESNSGDNRESFLEDLVKVVGACVDAMRKQAVLNPPAGVAPRKVLEATCPVSGDPVADLGSYWEFGGFPGSRFSKSISGRDFTVEEMSQVLAGASPVFEGFVSKKTGNKFSAGMEFDKEEKRLKFVFPEKSAPKDSGAVCPLTGDAVEDHGPFWVFPGKPEVKLWKSMAKRAMKVEDYSKLVETGKSDLLEGFVSSKSGNNFSAFLVWDGDRVGFEFPPRAGGGPSSPKMTGPGAKGKSGSGSGGSGGGPKKKAKGKF